MNEGASERVKPSPLSFRPSIHNNRIIMPYLRQPIAKQSHAVGWVSAGVPDYRLSAGNLPAIRSKQHAYTGKAGRQVLVVNEDGCEMFQNRGHPPWTGLE